MTSDEELMVELAQGEQAALEELLHRYERPLTGFVWRQTAGRDVEDLYQEAWLRVVRSAARFDPERRFSTWLFQIALNLCRDWHRKRPPEPVATDETGGHELAESRGGSGLAGVSIARSEAAMDTARLLERLSPQHREVVELRYYQDLAESEVSTILGIPRGTVKSRLHTALKMLLRHVSENPNPRSHDE